MKKIVIELEVFNKFNMRELDELLEIIKEQGRNPKYAPDSARGYEIVIRKFSMEALS